MRVKYDWNAKIQEYKNSGMGVTAWCRSQGIPDSTFCYHLHKEKPAKPAKPAKFIELKDASGITISCLGLSIEIHPSFDVTTLQKILKVLTTLC